MIFFLILYSLLLNLLCFNHTPIGIFLSNNEARKALEQDQQQRKKNVFNQPSSPFRNLNLTLFIEKRKLIIFFTTLNLKKWRSQSTIQCKSFLSCNEKTRGGGSEGELAPLENSCIRPRKEILRIVFGFDIS